MSELDIVDGNDEYSLQYVFYDRLLLGLHQMDSDLIREQSATWVQLNTSKVIEAAKLGIMSAENILKSLKIEY